MYVDYNLFNGKGVFFKGKGGFVTPIPSLGYYGRTTASLLLWQSCKFHNVKADYKSMSVLHYTELLNILFIIKILLYIIFLLGNSLSRCL